LSSGRCGRPRVIHSFAGTRYGMPDDPHTPGVKKRHEVPAALNRLANAQSGVVSREQARGQGVTDRVIHRLIREDRWRPLARGIYLTVPVQPSWDGLCWAGLLIGGDRARLGPRASGHLHQLLPTASQPVDILVPTGRSHRVDGPWQFSRERIGARTARSVGSPPRLTVADTVLDLCAAGSPSEVVGLLTRAAQLRIMTPQQLLAVMENRARQRHRGLIRTILGDVADGAESPIELLYLNDVERAHQLPEGRRQRSRLGLPYRSDVGYDPFQLLVELDGRIGHDGTGRFRDLDRDNRFAALSWLTLRYGWYDLVHRPCAVAFQVARVMITRGWLGLPSRCPRCAAVPELELLG